MSGRFASNTMVSVEQSQEQIKRTLRRYGATRFGVLEDQTEAAVMFEIEELTIRIVVPLPSEDDEEFTVTPERGLRRSDDAAWRAWEQAVKQRWRALLLAIKAKLEAVETGISTIETEFLPFVVLPDRRTVAEHLLPEIKRIARDGRMPKLLALPSGKGATS